MPFAGISVPSDTNGGLETGEAEEVGEKSEFGMELIELAELAELVKGRINIMLTAMIDVSLLAHSQAVSCRAKRF